jgi:SAM-dependent methyltransferase
MFDAYTQIFNSRGQQYHQAMLEFPDARRDEFEHVLTGADVEEGLVIGDLPSGGCYLRRFLKHKAATVSVETAQEFFERSQAQPDNTAILCKNLAAVPLSAGSLDRAVSLAGAHHLPNKRAFYGETRRLLKDDGTFSLADVGKGTGPDRFLNAFVHAHSTLGHDGDFLNDQTRGELEGTGFRVRYERLIAYPWRFRCRNDMVYYCRLLFGIDRASDQEVLEGIAACLGFEETAEECRMQWELVFLKAKKV